jgi:hypothetical protein
MFCTPSCHRNKKAKNVPYSIIRWEASIIPVFLKNQHATEMYEKVMV